MKLARVLLLTPISVAFLVPGLGCEQVAGIKDREYVENGAGGEAPTSTTDQGTGGGGPEAPNQLCEEYCDTVMEACTDEFTAYSGLATCYGICDLLPPGDALEPGGNTVECRLAQARSAYREPDAHCEAAGPGGDDVCGSNCESYCYLMERACPEDYATVDDCLDKCPSLRDVGRFDVVVDYDGDSLQCRLVHLSSASVDPEGHCHHSLFAPIDRCYDPAEDEPDCEEYCSLIDAACTGDLAQYESTKQCMSICEALEPGEIQHTVENTHGCRRYHAYSSFAAPETHCFHAGPLGDGHCGLDESDGSFRGNCESYCRLLEAGCTDDFEAAFASQRECQTDCASQPSDFLAKADTLYTVTKETTEEPTLHCRMLHLARAFEDETECAAAMGEAPCD